MIVQQISGTVAFFKAMTPFSSRTYSPLPLYYCFAKITQLEQRGEEEGRLTYIWLLVLVFVFMCMGYMFGVISVEKVVFSHCSPSPIYPTSI